MTSEQTLTVNTNDIHAFPADKRTLTKGVGSETLTDCETPATECETPADWSNLDSNEEEANVLVRNDMVDNNEM